MPRVGNTGFFILHMAGHLTLRGARGVSRLKTLAIAAATSALRPAVLTIAPDVGGRHAPLARNQGNNRQPAGQRVQKDEAACRSDNPNFERATVCEL
jgi:hypothetical protein